MVQSYLSLVKPIKLYFVKQIKKTYKPNFIFTAGLSFNLRYIFIFIYLIYITKGNPQLYYSTVLTCLLSLLNNKYLLDLNEFVCHFLIISIFYFNDILLGLTCYLKGFLDQFSKYSTSFPAHKSRSLRDSYPLY